MNHRKILKPLSISLKLSNLKEPTNQTNQRNFVYEESPVVLMKPAKSLASMNRPDGRIIGNSPPSSYRPRPGVRRDPYYSAETPPGMSPRRERPEIERNARGQVRGKNMSSPMANENGGRSPNRRRPMNVETQRRVSNDSLEQRRESPVQSPKICSRSTNRSPRRKPSAEIYYKDDKVSVPAENTVSESSLSTSSHTDIERMKLEDYNEGRTLLERCDKLLHSIAEITTTELQPSPVSVLDSSFYKEESSPSPVMKRCVEFKDPMAELEDDTWSIAIPHAESNPDDWDFMYISDILRALNYLPEDSDIFQFLEEQRHLKGKDTSKVSAMQRKLVFDTITEILNRTRHLPPWKGGEISLQQVWSEFQRIRERDASDDLFEVICGMLRKDLVGDTITGWGDCPIEMSEAVLDIERLIFKDLIGETIRDLAAFCRKGKCNQVVPAPRRKLVF
uniref:DUF4378 domain-containing protein n=1 Tax=Salix viminalis TaxID=40686 RepID=A0A6N2LCM9_SALVM